MATDHISLTSFLGSGLAASLAWIGGITRMVYNNKGKIEVLTDRTIKLDKCIVEVKDALIRQDEKLDRVIEHLLDQGGK